MTSNALSFAFQQQGNEMQQLFSININSQKKNGIPLGTHKYISLKAT